jgi:hypothetical protein
MLKIQPKTYEYKDFNNRRTKRVYGFIAQQIAEVIPEAKSVQKNTLCDIYNNFKCSDNIIHININEYEGTYNVSDKLICILKNGEFDCAIQEIHNTYIIIGKFSETDIFKNGKIEDDFDTLDKNYFYSPDASAYPKNVIRLSWSNKAK